MSYRLPNFKFDLSRRFRFQRLASLLSIASLVVLLSSVSFAVVQDDDDSDIPERPSTEKLLPETTVAFVQIDNFSDMIGKIRESAGGQLWNNEDVAPLVDGMWEEAKLAYDEEAKESVGLELDDLTSLPQGELTFAVIAPRRKNPEFFMLMELNNEDEALDRVLGRAREAIQEEAQEDISSETNDDGFEIESFNADDRKVYFFRHNDLLVGCTSEDELNAFIDRWMGREVEKTRPLAQNRKFVTIMNRCLGSDEIQPEARFFVDPINLAKSSTRGDIASQAAINFLPLIGLDGLLGIGGSMVLSEEDFDSVVHGHVLLSNPKSGVFEMLAFKPTNYEPETWVPADVTNYSTTSWDLDKLLAELTTMIETARGEEGVVDEFFENTINSELQLDFKEDILALLQGTITYTQWMQPPAAINSGVNAISVKLRDTEKAREVLQTVLDRINRDADEDRLVEVEYRGVSIWCEPDARVTERQDRIQQFRDRRREENGNAGRVEMEIQSQQPAFAIVGESLILSPQSKKFIEHAIDTELGSKPALIDDEEFRSISQKMAKLLKGELPCVLFFQNPQETIKSLMDVTKSDNMRDFMSQAAEESTLFGRFKGRLDDNPLPDFEKLQKYFTKSGGFATSDDTGYHFLFFNLKPEGLDE